MRNQLRVLIKLVHDVRIGSMSGNPHIHKLYRLQLICNMKKIMEYSLSVLLKINL